jgi:hypothetical protein
MVFKIMPKYTVCNIRALSLTMVTSHAEEESSASSSHMLCCLRYGSGFFHLKFVSGLSSSLRQMLRKFLS